MSTPDLKTELESDFDDVVDTAELKENYTVQSFLAPFVIVTRKSDGAVGTMEFTHDPRYYYRFIEDK